MKDKLKGFIVGVIITTIALTGIAAFSEARTQTLTALFDDIKVFLYGYELELTDANDNPVEPFIVDGTTYLPVRAISEALGLAVDWDGDTNSIYLDFLEWDDYYDDEYTDVRSFFEVFEIAESYSMVSYMKVGSTYEDYTELLFDYKTNGEYDEYPYVAISANMVSPHFLPNERGDAMLIDQWFSDVYGDSVNYIYYANPYESEEYVEPDGYLFITLLDSGNILVEQYGDIGLDDGITLDGEYEFIGVG